jgi:uncharacterized protein (DUF433 family)
VPHAQAALVVTRLRASSALTLVPRRHLNKPLDDSKKQAKNRGAMTFQDRIVRDPAICAGQPVVRGTRVTVRTILGYLAHGDTTAQILADYPSLTEDDVRAVVAFAAASASEDLPAPTPAPHEVKVA